jgi:hypothetical protein
MAFMTSQRFLRSLALGAIVLACGCSSVMHKATKQFADNLSNAILSEDDPGTVRDGVPAYLLLIDGLIQGDPRSDGLLLAGSNLYGAYAGGFVAEPERAQRLSKRSFDYAKKATCLRNERLCAAMGQPFEAFAAAVADTKEKDLDVLYGLASAWAGRIQQNSGDWNAIADIPKVQALFDRVIALDANYQEGQPYMYLGVLNSLRPASLGGTPELGKANFEKAIALSSGHNLMAKTLYAQYYARLVFDQELHDRLLHEVIAADPDAPRLTLINTLAQQRAKALLESGKDYF